MKKTLRILSSIVSIIMILSLCACSANFEAEGGMVGDGYFNNSMQDGLPNFDDSPIVGDNYGKPNEGEPGDDGNQDDEADNSPEGSYPSTDEMENMPEQPTEKTTTAPDDENLTNGDIETNEPTNDDKEDNFILAPFVNTSENRYSTFSADVDTASYTYFRKLVNSGYDWSMLRNSGSAFRAEEFINYFKYDVNAPKNGELFGIYTEMTPCPWDQSSMLFRLTLQAENAPQMAGNNLVFLIDVSGSMSSQDKLPLLKKAFSYLVGNLSPSDTVSIVTYSGKEAVVLDGCRGGDPSRILQAINSLAASGSTNGEAGLTMAYQVAEKHFIEGGNNRIIMASDGDLNVGISSASELTKYIEEKRDQGVYLSVLGFGTGNYRDDRMEALADNGNGVYYYIDGESEAEKVFGTDLMGTLYTVASDVKLQIEFNQDTVSSYRLIGYDNRILDKDDFENDLKDAGEVGASHQVTVCYEIKLSERDASVVQESFMTLRVRYKKPGETLSKLNEYTLGSEIYRAEATSETRFIASVIKTASLLRNREYNGNITIKSISNELDAMNLTKSEMTEFRELINKLAK